MSALSARFIIVWALASRWADHQVISPALHSNGVLQDIGRHFAGSNLFSAYFSALLILILLITSLTQFAFQIWRVRTSARETPLVKAV